jgi:hypothetical protein
MNQSTRQLLDAIRAALQPLPPSLTTSSQCSDIFEAYLFTVITNAARSEGANVRFETVQGVPPTGVLYFRTSPGHIHSTAWPYAHAVLEFPSKDPLEVHVGVCVVGKSQVLHECDVAVLDRQEATTCGVMRRESNSSKVWVSAEAKFYSSSLNLGLGRAYIGLIGDLSAKFSCFVANATSDSVVRLLAHNKSRNWYDEVTVNSSAASWLEGFIATALRNYKAR